MTEVSEHEPTSIQPCAALACGNNRSTSPRPVARSVFERSYGLLAPELIELVDALVAAVDIGRSWEIERLATALESFGASWLFADELRLNGTASPAGCICDGEGWL